MMDRLMYCLIQCVGVQYSLIHLTCSHAGPSQPKPAFCSPAHLKTVFKHFLISWDIFLHIIFLYACLFIE